jgi:hypothetical protein
MDENLESIYLKSNEIVEQVILYVNKFDKRGKQRETAIKYLRENFRKEDKIRYVNIAVLKQNFIDILGTKNEIVKLSLESLTKNIINHPELKIEDYQAVTNILNNPVLIKTEEIYGVKSIVIVGKHNSKLYCIVIKTTLDKNENYLTSFHRTNLEQMNKKR